MKKPTPLTPRQIVERNIEIVDLGSIKKKSTRPGAVTHQSLLQNPLFYYVGHPMEDCMKKGFFPTTLYSHQAETDLDGYRRFLSEMRETSYTFYCLAKRAAKERLILGAWEKPGTGSYVDILKEFLVNSAIQYVESSTLEDIAT